MEKRDCDRGIRFVPHDVAVLYASLVALVIEDAQIALAVLVLGQKPMQGIYRYGKERALQLVQAVCKGIKIRAFQHAVMLAEQTGDFSVGCCVDQILVTRERIVGS